MWRFLSSTLLQTSLAFSFTDTSVSAASCCTFPSAWWPEAASCSTRSGSARRSSARCYRYVCVFVLCNVWVSVLCNIRVCMYVCVCVCVCVCVKVRMFKTRKVQLLSHTHHTQIGPVVDRARAACPQRRAHTTECVHPAAAARCR